MNPRSVASYFGGLLGFLILFLLYCAFDGPGGYSDKRLVPDDNQVHSTRSQLSLWEKRAIGAFDGKQPSRCDRTEATFEELIRRSQDRFEKKLALLHVSNTGEILIKSGNVDHFTWVYVYTLAEKIEEAIRSTAACGFSRARQFSAVTLLVASNDFAEQITSTEEWLELAGEGVFYFGSCMTEATAAKSGIMIPRPYAKKEELSWHGCKNVERCHNVSKRVQLEHLWSSKRNAVVFRGSMSSADRAVLALAARQVPTSLQHLIDIKITGIPEGAPCWKRRSDWCPGGPKKWIRENSIHVSGGVEGRLDMAEQAENFRYILSADGVGCADRLTALLASSSALALQVSPYQEFWYADMIPGKHYIPVARNFSNLTGAILEADKNNGKLGRSIVLAANDFEQRFLRPDLQMCYLRSILLQYSHHTVGTCTRPTDTLPYKEWFALHKKRIESPTVDREHTEE